MEQPSITEFVDSVTGKSHLRVEVDYGGGFVRLKTSEAERRQAAQDIQCCENFVLELLRNSRDAHCSNVYVAMWRTQEMRHITVVDDGDACRLCLAHAMGHRAVVEHAGATMGDEVDAL